MNTSLANTSTPVKKENATVCYQPRFYVDRSEVDTIVQVELPGVSKENLKLTVENKELILEGTVATIRPESWNALHRESRDRIYQLRLRLGDQVDQSAISADMADGVLTLTFPKMESAKPRKIKVK